MIETRSEIKYCCATIVVPLRVRDSLLRWVFSSSFSSTSKILNITELKRLNLVVSHAKFPVFLTIVHAALKFQNKDL